MKRMLIIVAVSCLTITNAFAGKHGKQDGKAAQQAPAQQAVQQSGKLVGGYEAWREPQNLTVGVMKVACSNPHAIGNQISPGSFTLTCPLSKTFWRQDDLGTVALGNNGTIGAEAQSNKGDSIGYDRPLVIGDDSASCFTSRQYRVSANPSFVVDCEDVVALPEKADLTDVCATLIASQGESINLRAQQATQAKGKGAAQQAAGLAWSEPVATGNVYSNCPSAAQGKVQQK